MDMQLQPIGYVSSEISKPAMRADAEGLTLEQRIDEIREAHRRTRATVCTVEIEPQFEDLLLGVEEFSHVLVLYWPHLAKPGSRELRRVHPMGRQEIPERGIFATCSPARPNPVLLSAVRLLKREGTVLTIQGLEAVDGSPVIDIKPYNPTYYRVDAPTLPDWMERIRAELAAG